MYYSCVLLKLFLSFHIYTFYKKSFYCQIKQSPDIIFSANDGQPEYKRRRHHSGVSSCDIDDIAEELVFMEARIAVELSGGNFSWDLKSREVFLKDINVKIPTGISVLEKM